MFFFPDITLLMLAGHYFAADNGAISVSIRLQKAGGLFGFLTSFLAWYNALAGIQDARQVSLTSSGHIIRRDILTR